MIVGLPLTLLQWGTHRLNPAVTIDFPIVATNLLLAHAIYDADRIDRRVAVLPLGASSVECQRDKGTCGRKRARTAGADRHSVAAVSNRESGDAK